MRTVKCFRTRGFRLRPLVIAVAVGFVVSCGAQDRDADVAAPDFSVETGETEPTPAGQSLDEIFAEIGERVPGFAGVHIGADGRAIIQMVDTSDAVAARAAVSSRFRGVPGLGNGTTRVARVEHSFLQLRRWKNDLYADGVPSQVHYVDIDERRNVLHLGVYDAVDIGPVRSRVIRSGIPARAVIVDVVAPVRPLRTEYLTSPVRPTMGGLNIVRFGAQACTLGFNAKKTGSLRYFVTNAHCTQTFGAVNGDVFGQPLGQSNYRIGFEVTDPPFVTGGNCPAVGGCRWSDAALIRYDSAGVGFHSNIARTVNQFGSIELAESPFHVEGEVGSSSLVIGTFLSKVGVASGWTSGNITGTCVEWLNFPAPGYALLCQYNASAGGAPGDSGSPVFTYDASTGKAWLIGILHSAAYGAMTFSPLDGVKTDLGAMTVSFPVL